MIHCAEMSDFFEKSDIGGQKLLDAAYEKNYTFDTIAVGWSSPMFLVNKLSVCSFFAIIALAFVAIMPTIQQSQVYWASEVAPSTQRSHSDTGGQTASPNPSGNGFDQEEKVRQLLAKQYEQRYGASDEAIRAALSIKGKVADFVGYHARMNRWLIAESKGGNLSDAFDQLSNTMRGVLTKQPKAKIELRIYVNSEKHQALASGSDFGGYRMNAQGYWGWYSEAKQWVYAEIEDIKILVLRTP